MIGSKQIRIGITASIKYADSDSKNVTATFDTPVPDTVAEAYVWLSMHPQLMDLMHDLAAALYAASHLPSEVTVPGQGVPAPVPRTAP